MDRLYIIEGSKDKTHLAYFKRDTCRFHEEYLVMACFPSLEVECRHGCKTDYYIGEATREIADEWDRYHNEVTCPNCLKWAKGKEISQPKQMVMI